MRLYIARSFLRYQTSQQTGQLVYRLYTGWIQPYWLDRLYNLYPTSIQPLSNPKGWTGSCPTPSVQPPPNPLCPTPAQPSVQPPPNPLSNPLSNLAFEWLAGALSWRALSWCTRPRRRVVRCGAELYVRRCVSQRIAAHLPYTEDVGTHVIERAKLHTRMNDSVRAAANVPNPARERFPVDAGLRGTASRPLGTAALLLAALHPVPSTALSPAWALE